MITLSSLDIQAFLPHRYPFLLVDKVLEIVPGKTIVAIKNVTINEPFFQGHFPEDPIMPGVLILEIMAQVAFILASYAGSSTIAENYILASIDCAKFKRAVVPGDQLKIAASLQWKKLSFVKCQVEVTVEDQIVCVGEITGAKRSTT